VLLAIDIADIIFAIDSIPAVIAITRDSFIVYSSNICAIMGLRSIYFALAGVMKLFRYLNYGLSIILIFIGGKMLAEELIHVPVAVTLLVIVSLLSSSILASILIKPKSPRV
jgi:tellurite resistance protein TerC